MRADGRCLTCLGERQPERSRKYGKGAADLDPFCSTDCAKAWYGTKTYWGRRV